MQRFLAAILLCGLTGCSALPDIVHQPQYHNPFPQLSRIAVLPFYNQSADPTVDGDQVALSYYNELQAVPGYEVVPVGVVKQALLAMDRELRTPEEFQKFAQLLGVDAVVVGSVTEFSPYYPPRMGLSVRWYAANPNFHPIPPGYGLPWGTAHEEYIPQELVFEAEFALAKEQLKTQTPEFNSTAAEQEPESLDEFQPSGESKVVPAQRLSTVPAAELAEELPLHQPLPPAAAMQPVLPGSEPTLPPDWPDPRGFIPPAPAPTRPRSMPQCDPVLTHTRLYHGTDGDFTRRLANYCYFREDARFSDWQGYLQRSDDFIRFCCHLHITEMLTARGGAGETRVVWRWPIRRYER